MERFSSLFLCQKLVHLIHAVAVYLRPLLEIIFTSIFSSRVRLRAHDSGGLNQDDKQINLHESELEDATGCGDFVFQSEEEHEPEEICLKFKFPTFEEFSKSQKGTGDYSIDQQNSLNIEVVFSPRIGEFEVAVVEELETFPGKEEIDEDEFTDGNSEEEFDQTVGAHGRGDEVLVVDVDENEEPGAKIDFPENSENKAYTDSLEHELNDENLLSSDKISMITDSDSEFMGFDFTLPQADGFISDCDFGGEPDDEKEKTETYSELSGFEENQDSSDDFSDEDSDILEELEKLEEASNSKPPDDKGFAFLGAEDFKEGFETDDASIEESGSNEKGPRNGDENTKKSSSNETGSRNGGENIKKSNSEDFFEDADELESLWEHQELIERLKMELKKVRGTGLPMILEESDSPKMMDDLKPWKIDEFQRDNCSGGLHQFYKSYRDKMRKFDIINYQKMCTMGVLRLKDPRKPIPDEKPSPPTLKSLVSRNLSLFGHKIHGADPTGRLARELEGELEAVYVGQMCLSWEFLHWQYERVLDLWETDRRGSRRFNEVAGEFQQFQVLVQRFVEDEPFHGQPRVRSYVETRCAGRSLLQVPIIREDNTRDKAKAKAKATDENVVTSEMLVETVEESIRIFWKFVRADKECTITSLDRRRKTPDLPDPEDLGLWMNIKKNLRKKDRKIKDMVRRENCILRKLRQCREDEGDEQVLYFFSQVDMKLVCRVLNMSRITRDRLMWCRDKLNRISFVNRRIHVEPSFLLFPS